MELKGFLLISAVLITSGCMSLQTDAHISSDAEIDKVETEITFASDRPSSYSDGGFMSQNLSESEISDQFNQTSTDNFNFSEMDVNLIDNQNMTGVSLTYYDVVPSEDSEIDVYKENGEVVFEDPEYELMSASDSSSGNMFNTGAGLNQDQNTVYDPYCLGGTGFIGEDADISEYYVEDGELILEVRNSAMENIQLQSVQVAGQETETSEDLEFYDAANVTIEDLNPVEAKECQTYDIEVTHSQNGEETTVSGELELEYILGDESASAETDENDAETESSGLGGLGMGSGLEETPEDLDELGTYEQTMISMMNESIDIKYRVHMPGEIVEANGTEKDGNVVEYGFDEVVKEEEPYVRSKSGAGLVGSFTQWLNNLF